MPSQPRLLKVLTLLTPLLVLGMLAMVLWFAPVERSMGAVQKLFYLHLAAAWVHPGRQLVSQPTGRVWPRLQHRVSPYHQYPDRCLSQY